jgi:hypothetical protein
MVISDRYRYLFVELPHTGSTAVSRELCEHYDGRKILHKHATYEEFLRVATPEQRTYFVFSTVRNPLDEAVSVYHKFATDHRHRFSDPAKLAKRSWLARHRDLMKYRFARRDDVDFPAFVRRFYRWPYNSWSHLSHGRFDAVMRYETLADDFASVLRQVGLTPQRRLPVVNATGGRRRGFADYYTRELIPHAMAVFGPYMERWGYAAPDGWGEPHVTRVTRVRFAIFNAFRILYWRLGRP